MMYSFSLYQRRKISAICSISAAVSLLIAGGELNAQNYLSQAKSSDTEKTRRLGEAIEEQSNEVKRLSDELNELRALLDRDNPPAPVELPREPVETEPRESLRQEESKPVKEPAPLPPIPESEQDTERPSPPTPPEKPAPKEPNPENLASGQALEHQVQPGETLTAIGTKYGITWQKIADANGITDPKLVRVGQVLKIPGKSKPIATVKPETPSSPQVPEEKPEKPATPNAATIVTVNPGDTVSSIARSNNTTIAAIVAANPGINPERIQVGQKIRLTPGAPSPRDAKRAVPIGSHIVKEGETLSSIARQYGTTAAALVALNQLPDAEHIRIGQKLKVPAKPTSPSADLSPLPPVPTPIDKDRLVPYEVKAGETLYGIGRKLFLAADEIAQMNNLPNDAKLQAGQELLVPMHALYSRSVAPVSDLRGIR